MMYDTFHANIEEKNIAAAMQSCWDQVVHVHISENDRSTPGEGHVDWDTTFQMLKQLRYDGWLVVEAFGLSLPALAAATKIWRRMFPDEDVPGEARAGVHETPHGRVIATGVTCEIIATELYRSFPITLCSPAANEHRLSWFAVWKWPYHPTGA